MSKEEVVEKIWLNYSLEMLAKLSCIPQINRYEYYISRGEGEKARRVVEESVKNILDKRSFIEDLQVKISKYMDEFRELDKGKLRDHLMNLENIIKDAMYELNNLPWYVAGCHLIKGHTLSILYALTNTIDHIERFGFVERYFMELSEYLKRLKNHLDEILKLIPTAPPKTT